MVALQDLKTSLNGRLVALFRNDKEAYELLKSVNIPIAFGQASGVDFAGKSIAANYYTTISNLCESIEVGKPSVFNFISDYPEAFNTLGSFQTENVDLARSIVRSMGGNPLPIKIGKTKKMWFLSARSVVFFLLTRQLGFSKAIGNKLSIPIGNDPSVLAEMSGLKIERSKKKSEPVATTQHNRTIPEEIVAIIEEIEPAIKPLVSIPSPLQTILSERQSYIRSIESYLESIVKQIADLEETKRSIEQQKDSTIQEITALEMALDLLSTDTKISGDNGCINNHQTFDVTNP